MRTTFGATLVWVSALLAVGASSLGCDEPPPSRNERASASTAGDRSNLQSSALPKASASPPAAKIPEQWVAAGDGFTAMFPTKPTPKEEQVPFDGGSAKQVTYTSRVGPAWFRVTTSDYDLPAIPPPQVMKELIEGQAVDSLALTSRLQAGTELSKGWVKQGTHDAYEFQVKVTREDNGTHYWRMLFIKNRMYQLVVHVPEGGDPSHKDRFFKHFEPGPAK